MRKGRRLLILPLLMLMLCGGCGRSDAVILGLDLELSGKHALYGTACADGVRLAVEEKNAAGGLLGRPVALAEMDNRSLGSEAALAALRLEGLERASAVIGPSTSGTAKAVAGSGVALPVIVPTATADDLMAAGEAPIFRLCYTDRTQGRVMGSFGRALGLSRAMVITESSSDYARGASDAFIERFGEMGGEIAGQLFYPSGESDFHPLITRMRAERFDCIFLPGYYGEAGLFLRQLRAWGIEVPVLGCDSFDSPAIETIGGRALGAIYFSNHCDPADPAVEAFAGRFQARFGYAPNAYAILGYEAARLSFQAIERAGSDDPAAVRAVLEDPDFYYEGLTGGMRFDGEGNAVKRVWINTIDEGARYALGEGRED